mgnify:CR=1 FL=1
MKPEPATPASTIRRRPRWLFRTGAILFGLALILAAELICRIAGWGIAAEYEDPFVGFKGINPLFELSADGGDYSIPKAKLKYFSPESFTDDKGKGAFRIFCLGGSTVKGRPYAKETAFSTWLELALQAAEPDREWEVVNCGGISYASYRLVHILRECIGYQPDLFVICTGHNEFLEDRSYEGLKGIPDSIAFSQHWAARTRIYQLLRSALGKNQPADPSRFKMAKDVEALLDFKGGLETYVRSDEWRDDVVRHFEHNLRAMIAMAEDAGIPVMLIQPPSNLRNSPPFKSQHRDGLGIDQVLAFEQAIERAMGQRDMNLTVKHLREALAIDDRYAITHYVIGKCLEILGQKQAAMKAYRRALNEDVCPLRMIEPLVAALARVCSETRVPLIDIHALLEKESPSGILGHVQLVDHIHPTIDGHKVVADAILTQMEKAGWGEKSEAWDERRDTAYSEHFETLDATYFIEAKRALHGLNEWAAGRAKEIPIASQPSPVKE